MGGYYSDIFVRLFGIAAKTELDSWTETSCQLLPQGKFFLINLFSWFLWRVSVCECVCECVCVNVNVA